MVLPGVDDVIANLECPVSIFIRDDFPTLDLPIKAYSGSDVFGHMSALGLEMMNFAELIFIKAYKYLNIR